MKILDWLIITNLIWLTAAVLIYQNGASIKYKMEAEKLQQILDDNQAYYEKLDYVEERFGDRLRDFISLEEIEKLKRYDSGHEGH